MTKPNANPGAGESRRSFLKKTAVAGAAVAGASAAGLWPAYGQNQDVRVWITSAADDPVVTQEPVRWAMEHLRGVLTERGINARVGGAPDAVGISERIVAISRAARTASSLFAAAGVVLPDAAESLALTRGRIDDRSVLLACGADARGLVYALLELADRVRFAADPIAELRGVKRVVQKPANAIRGISRLFASDVEDKPWFNDRAFWPRYLDELATHRFNRFNLALGLGYDFTTDIHDCYLHFAYPFLVSPPDYHVRAVPLPDEERSQNLTMLRFISEETVRRGLHFQLGLWTHAYQWTNSPDANYIIEGLTPANHAAYCRDALEMLLRACPAIGGVTIRTHGESGVAEGNYEFWKIIFDGVTRCGRRVEIDLHAKGINDKIIESALATGMPVNISPKFWAEHMGLGYMQGAIRPQEMPPQDQRDRGFFSLSTGSRSFMRYGYGDLLREDRRYGVLHRLWPGTQRLLLWSDPAMAADYGRVSSFCGSAGVEWLEPLSFKGRKGSGLPGGRTAYADSSLRPVAGDFEKYAESYRVWGRHIYDPDCDPDEWRRPLNKEFGRAAPSVETALAEAGRILPLFTVAHCPSAANNNYWPEMYWNMPVVDANRRHPYSDTPSPKRFGAVSPLDPEFFSRIDDFAEALVKAAPDAKYSPAWVAAALEAHANDAATAVGTARSKMTDAQNPTFRRVAADVAIQSGLGHFFARKLRAGILFAVFDRTRHKPALEAALAAYRSAREAWATMAGDAVYVYRKDVTFGPEYFQRGHWQDRLPAIDADIGDMEALLKSAGGPDSTVTVPDARTLSKIIETILRTPPGMRDTVLRDFHTPPKSFRRGDLLTVEADCGHSPETRELASLHLRYRRLNQAEVWQSVEMDRPGTTARAVIPANYTDSPFPLQYHFELREKAGMAWLYPGLKPGWQGQPYYVVRQS